MSGDSAVDGGGTESHETSLQTIERTLKTFPTVSLDCPNKPSSAPGHLTITDRRLIWRTTPDTPEEQAWTTSFLEISLHALSTDPDSGYPPCIYAQIGDDGIEVRFIPSAEDSETLREIYDVMCEGAALCVDSEGEDGETGGIFGGMMMPGFGESGPSPESGIGIEGAAEALAMLDGAHDGSEDAQQQFADAVETDHAEETNGG